MEIVFESLLSMKKIYCSPFEVKNNDYINIHKLLFEELGYDVCSIKSLKFTSFLNRKNNIVYINWFEDAIVGHNGKVKFNLFLFRFILLLFLRVSCFKLIWIQHNITPHMLIDGSNSSLFKFFIRVLYFLCDFKVTHAKVDDFKKSVVIDHPLYPNIINDCGSIIRQVDYLYIGTISEYKGLDRMLEIWPEKLHLKILGYCKSSILEAKIFEIIKRRKLKVTFENKFLSDNEVELNLKMAKVVILPHIEKSMIVSGMFYHAISNGCSILMRNGHFYDYVSTWFSNVQSFDNKDFEQKLETAISSFDSTKTIYLANSRCSKEVLKVCWSAIFNRV